MIALQLPQHRKARVWFREMPNACVESGDAIERSLGDCEGCNNGSSGAAIEVLIPHGPSAFYGLLGAELRPSRSGALLVRVMTSDGVGMPFHDSIAIASDEAYVGLPRQFSQSILTGATSQITGFGGLGSGELEFAHGAHSLRGSSPIVFKWLAANLVKLLREGEAIGQQKLLEILQSPLR